MPTKNERRAVASLATSKGRRQSGLFVAEGTKCVLETMGEFELQRLYATQSWLEEHGDSLQPGLPVEEVKRSDIIEMSSLSTPADVLAVYHIPSRELVKPSSQTLSIALDGVQDPGNLGTIIRIAAWMGIKDIYCSHDTVDVYNPKVVQATMGALGRVGVHYLDLATLLGEASKAGIPVYGTFLDGEVLYDTQLSTGGVLVMGNEGKGITAEVARTVNHRLYIPPFPLGLPAIESLNVAVATAITVAEFRRQAMHDS